MNKKQLRHAYNEVLKAAESVTCKDLHHKQSQRHAHDEVCMAEYELYKHCDMVREHLDKL